MSSVRTRMSDPLEPGSPPVCGAAAGSGAALAEALAEAEAVADAVAGVGDGDAVGDGEGDGDGDSEGVGVITPASVSVEPIATTPTAAMTTMRNPAINVLAISTSFSD
jgi:hypothetical protein